MPTAVITGANGGIGLAIAETFLQQDYRVILPYRFNKQNIEKLVVKYGAEKVTSILLDIGDITQIPTFVEKLATYTDRVDVLINNAGITDPMPLEVVDEAAWDKMFNVNAKGPFFLSQALFPFLKKAEYPSIVNITSMSGHEASPGMGIYSISKASVLMMTKHMALEWSPYNIRVNCVSPGLIHTPLTTSLYENEKVHTERKQIVPLQRIGQGEDIAPITAFLASPKSSYITGQSIIVDGGLLASIHAHIAGPPKLQMEKLRQENTIDKER